MIDKKEMTDKKVRLVTGRDSIRLVDSWPTWNRRQAKIVAAPTSHTVLLEEAADEHVDER